MARYWQDLTDEISTLLRDDSKSSFPEPLRIAAFNRAAQYFSQTHTSLYKNVTAVATAYGNGAIVNLPSDFVELPGGGVSTDRGRWLEPSPIIAGERVPSRGYQIVNDGIYLFDPDIKSVTLWYYANYNRVANVASLINTPVWAEWALMNLTMAYCLYPNMTGQASLRQFQPRRDAGDPEDSPPRIQSRFFINVYKEIVGGFPMQDRSILFRPN